MLLPSLSLSAAHLDITCGVPSVNFENYHQLQQSQSFYSVFFSCVGYGDHHMAKKQPFCNTQVSGRCCKNISAIWYSNAAQITKFSVIHQCLGLAVCSIIYVSILPLCRLALLATWSGGYAFQRVVLTECNNSKKKKKERYRKQHNLHGKLCTCMWR